MERVPPGGRCTCGAVLWAVRGRVVGEGTTFACRRCRNAYAPQEGPRWTPGAPEDAAPFVTMFALDHKDQPVPDALAREIDAFLDLAADGR